MTHEIEPHRIAAWKTNLQASLTYANRLVNQIPRSRGARCVTSVDLALIARLLLLDELNLLSGEKTASNDHLEILLNNVCTRLGYRLCEDPSIMRYYTMEVTTATGSFTTIVSCADGIAPEAYTALLYAPRGEGLSFRMIAEVTSTEAEAMVQERLAKKSEEKKLPVAQLAIRASVNATTEELELIEFAEQNGIVEAYGSVVRRRQSMLHQAVPRNMGMAFLSFLRSLAELELPTKAHDALGAEFGGAIKAYHANGIAMILVDGEIRWFCIATELPNHHKKQGAAMLSVRGKKLMKGRPIADPLLKTRQGYVPAHAHIFLQALLHFGKGNPRREMLPVSIQPDKK